MLPAGFEPTIPASERPQTHALDSAATGILFVTLRPTNYVTNQGEEWDFFGLSSELSDNRIISTKRNLRHGHHIAMTTC
jgi:hypothetical protein